MPLLELNGLQAWYGQRHVLHGVDISVEEGQIVALLGANGAGKTTTLRSISGMVSRSGQMCFNGRPLSRAPADETARLGIAHVPEGRGTMGQMSVLENLRLGAYVRRDRKNVAGDFRRVFEYFPWLAQRQKQAAGTLSGGEQQMLAVGRALMSRPKLLLLDEPSLGLAPLVVRSIVEIVATINRTDGVAVLLVEQNAALALNVAHQAYVLESGRVVLSGKADELSKNESVRRSYLGY